MEKGNEARNGGGLAAWLKRSQALFIVAAIIVMAAISLCYFYPDAMQGNVLSQHDVTQGIANGQEAKTFTAETGERTWWTNSLFSGMPMFQIAPSYGSSALLSWINDVYGLWLPSPANLLFMMMAGFFILMLACRVRWHIALIGAIAYAFSTYFIIIIGAGHIWKFYTLAYVPPTIAGIVWCYRGRYLAGGAVAALAAAMQVSSNHPQITYYFLFLIAALAIGYLVIACREKRVKQWGIATATLAVAAVLAVLANSPNLYNTYQYSKETMRGGHSELATATPNATKGGLDRDYITAWSYGKSETFTLLIPNVDGGATLKPVDGKNQMLTLADTDQAKRLLNEGEISAQDYQYLSQFPQYFGDQPMTNGPVYVGALIFALFIVGCIIIKGPLKWAVLIATIITVMLSWGHNMMWLTDLFIDHFPLYNKFRTVSSILVVAEFTIPLMAMLALQKILFDKQLQPWQRTATFATLGICAAVCLIVYWFPGIFNLYSEQEQPLLDQGLAQQLPTLFAAIEQVRSAMISADAIRSFIVIALGAGVIFVAQAGKIKPAVAAALIGVVVLVDLYTVNKRYLSSDSFTKPTATNEQLYFAKRPVDEQILQDTAMNYRVLDVPLFEDAMPSFYHKSVGGYHAAKLTRYQDLMTYQMDFRNSRVNFDVLNMLNTKYVIMPTAGGGVTALPNPHCMGNAWLVNDVRYVGNANEEIDAIDSIDVRTTAVVDQRFAASLGDWNVAADSVPKAAQAGLTLTSYAPNRLAYTATTDVDRVAVFSEIYYPDWTATIDGQPVEIARADYILRALRIPAGQHEIVFTFDPVSIRRTEAAAYTALGLLVAGVAWMAVSAARRRRREAKSPATKS